MAVTYISGATPVGVTDTSAPFANTLVNFPWATYAPNAGDLNIGWVAVKPYSTVPAAPAGWHTLGTIASGAVAPGNDTGSVSLTLFSKINLGAETDGYPSWFDQYNPAYYGNYGFRKTAPTDWIVHAAFAADTNATTTAIATTSVTAPRFKTGDFGLMLLVMPSDTSTVTSPVLSIPGCTLSSLTAVFNAAGTTAGTDERIYVWTFTVTAGIATGPPSITGTASSSATSSVATAVVRIAEASATELVASLVDIGPSVLSALPPPLFAKSAEVTITSPSSSTAVSNAKTNLISVTSPAATYTAIQKNGAISGSLEVSVAASALLRSVSAAQLASESPTAVRTPVEVQVWNPLHTQMLAVLEGRDNMQWLDDLNDAGSSSFELHRYDPKATPSILASFNLVKFVYGGVARFVSRIDKRELTVSKNDDHAGQVWQVTGMGGLSLLADAALYPEYGVNEFTQKDRNFFFGSREGAWYVPSEWIPPRSLPLATIESTHPWYGHPAGWPDPTASWIWATDPNQLATAGTQWFRSYFTLTAPTTVTIYMSADDYATLYLDGYSSFATETGAAYSFRKFSSKTVKLGVGPHLIAVQVDNNDLSLEDVQPITVGGEITPTYAYDSNKPYLSKGFTDGGHKYVNADGSVDGWGAGPAALDGDPNTAWVSVGNYLGWTSAYEYVEATFPSTTVTAIRVHVFGGPYTVFVSLKNGGNDWNGDAIIPYKARVVNAGSNIRYIRTFEVQANQDATFNIDPMAADRIRITLHATWDSGWGQYRWRGGIRTIRVSNEAREGTYIRGGNFAGLLLSVATTDDSGAVTGIIHRSQTDGWVVKTGERPGWRPAHILLKIIEEAKARSVLGVSALNLGFDDQVDSYQKPWKTPRKDVAYGTGEDYLSIVRKLVSDSNVDIWLDPSTLTLHAAERRGDDHSEGVGSIVLRPGQSLTDFSIESGRPGATRLMVESEFGWLEAGDFEAEDTYGRIEDFVSYGSALSIQEARESAAHELERFSVESWDSTTASTGIIGPRPYIDYNVGDYILLPTGFGPELGINRVLSFRISEGDTGDLKIITELDRVREIPPLSDAPPEVQPPEEVRPPLPPPVIRSGNTGSVSNTALPVELPAVSDPGDYLVVFFTAEFTDFHVDIPEPITAPELGLGGEYEWKRIAWHHYRDVSVLRYTAVFGKRLGVLDNEHPPWMFTGSVATRYAWSLLVIGGAMSIDPLDGHSLVPELQTDKQNPIMAPATPRLVGDHLAIAAVHTVNAAGVDGRPSFTGTPWTPVSSAINPSNWSSGSPPPSDMLHLFSTTTERNVTVGGTDGPDTGTIPGVPDVVTTATIILRASPSTATEEQTMYGDHLIIWAMNAAGTKREWVYKGGVITTRPTDIAPYTQGGRAVWDTSTDPTFVSPPPLAVFGDVWIPHGDVNPTP